MANCSPLALVVNCGSSSLKFALFDTSMPAPLVDGLAERLGSDEATIRFHIDGTRRTTPIAGAGHQQAFDALLAFLTDHGLSARIGAVGHRVVHGGERFTTSVEITEEVMAGIAECAVLAPLHNPANLVGIRAAMAALPDARHVAVFDTAFHQTIPEEAYLYALPQRFRRDLGVRRYGFHGTSHRYVAGRAVEFLGLDPKDHGLIVLHLGNGASATAVRNGISVDTSMGLTPVEGLVMGTRCGDVDAGALTYIARRAGLDVDALDAMVNKESGLLGLSELSNDCRTLEAAAAEGHAGARMALDVFAYRIARTVGALRMPLARLDAVVFTGGIGENSASVRASVIARLGFLGMNLDEAANRATTGGNAGCVSGPGRPAALVMPTDEERMIACDAASIAFSNAPVAFSVFAEAAE
ncbi:acetate kinase [Rhodobium orientis]|uniref:Acetate kinase n=1 Tax=Rhodobium orientis TaxID=34017 RepID=A0A327JQL7_9HYPH|nr:acetate kinase [Rhodobium orientis]MBB4301896.1 acetate kinase [Rhodobium orientis]MBK5950134.1 acetate kinase [Rhodobium orientis]RAI25688.1 acetate kinase [Rhodobium orientis]